MNQRVADKKAKARGLLKTLCQGCETFVNKLNNYHGVELCTNCNDQYNNVTGHCSLNCSLTGRCDESC